MKWIVLVLGVLLNAGASILMKVSSMPPRKLPSLTTPIAEWVTNWPFWVGVVTYGLAFVLYVIRPEPFPGDRRAPDHHRRRDRDRGHDRRIAAG